MNLESALDKIRTMEVRGAGRIARFAAKTVQEHVNESKASSSQNLEIEIMEILKKLNATRPTAVSLKNGLRYIYQNSIKKVEGAYPPLNEFKKMITSAADEFIKKSEAAVDKIADIGSQKIESGYKIQTHCNSHSALAVIKKAHDQGKSLEVFASESRPWYQGHLTARELTEAGIPVTLIVDSAVRYFMDFIDVVLVGADTITAGGELINKIGTAQVALAANDAGVPFYVCAETYKFSPESLNKNSKVVVIEERDKSEVLPDHSKLPGVKIANPVFDITPAKYIKGIITDVGIIEPEKSSELIVNEFGEESSIDFLESE